MTTDRSGKPVGLTCDGMADPLGVDHPYPLLAYIPGCRQQAVRFVILRAEGSDPPVYDSGWRETSLCQHQPEQPLESRTAYVWYAEVRDMVDFHAWIEETLPIARRYTVTYGTASLQVLVVDKTQ